MLSELLVDETLHPVAYGGSSIFVNIRGRPKARKNRRLQHSVDPAGPPGYAGGQPVKQFMIISDSPNAFPVTG
jgi:hypothetical protein